MAHILITGGTGFIGMHTLQQLSREEHTVTVLVRSLKKWEQICRQMNLETAWHTGKLTPVIGDLSAPALGLSPSDRKRVETADVVIHAGGPMDILLGEEEARGAFLQAAEEMLTLAAHIHASKGLRHFIHLVGFKSPFNHHNWNAPEPVIAHSEQAPPYERMKFLADLRIRQGAHKEGFPLSVIHLSVVIGDSAHGDTPQTVGLGILVASTARKLTGLIPGGKSHWLPMVHVDHAAEFISVLAKETHPVSETYYLMDERQQSPTMMELGTNMAKELRVRKPWGSISPAWLSSILGTPIGRKLGIPKESLDFIVDVDYPLDTTRAIQHKHGLTQAVNTDVLPFVITDLDYRIAHSRMDTDGFVRSRRGPLATLERRVDNVNPPIVFVHGTLSGADCLIPLAEQFPESSVCLVDLPGFGRSPYHHQEDILEGHIESLVQAIQTFKTPIRLVGHSFGGLLTAKVWERLPERISSLHLLQPVFHPAPRRYRSARITESVLGRLSESGLRKQLLSQTCFESMEAIPPAYITYVLEELRSPRVKKTTAEALAMLTRSDSFRFASEIPGLPSKEKVSIVWGMKDQIYTLPEQFHGLHTLHIPAAHHFPISQPKQTAHWLKQHIEQITDVLSGSVK
ncbi:alpha/beta fold hydrolase [Paenibacillus brasilensis]|uniref:Thioester reductase-like protein/pimeloyl-ACP methyl ester carboxylesterase n=1 Tax=Paenibacillus brasilensis TaxID=128574 RepID=A0ABU0KY27_9BACL|nr:alpha/beta fold hydrolase [Paenibacillus brasilensis]MDQ0493465.1 thioester reductase-like protein/pimeloyl-ACP methyl ester carboxylesterase [Paenibacillus brasilensis]